MWGPLTNLSQDLTKWEKHPIETLHAELCKNILHVHQHTTNNACRAELGKYPLISKIQKRAIKFWKHLKLSDPQHIRINQITAQIKQSYITHWQSQTQQQSTMQCYLSLKREYSMAEYLFTVSDKKLRSTLTRCEIVFTLWSESDGNRIALPNRMLQINRYTDSVLRQNTADPSHI